jgi:hypothetical protein
VTKIRNHLLICSALIAATAMVGGSVMALWVLLSSSNPALILVAIVAWSAMMLATFPLWARLEADSEAPLAASNKRDPRDPAEIASFFLPKKIREPWLGDLREDRASMQRAGYSRRFIFWATATQVTLLFVHWFKQQILSVLSRSPRQA